jgi:predicted DNA-binding protein
MSIQNEKAVQIPVLKNKVILSFRCQADLKNRLSSGAVNRGLTSSEYIESFLEDHTDIYGNYQESESDMETRRKLIVEKEELQQQVSFYENYKLKEFLARLRGKEFSFVDADGNHKSISVKEIKDVLTLLIHSFKIGTNL